MSCSDIFLGLIAVLFPPVAVWIKSGLCSADSLINILLCVLGYIPGLIHAWYIIAKYPEHDSDYEALTADESGQRQQRVDRNGRVTYYYVNQQGRQQQQPRQAGQQGSRTYGTQQGAITAGKPKAAAGQQTGSGGASNNATVGGSSRQTDTEEQGGAPPAYSEVVRGDNKIQSQD